MGLRMKRLCILGGTGFVGRHLLNRLDPRQWQARVLTRHPQRHRELTVLPGIELIKANVHTPTELEEHFRDCDAVINLVGILNQWERSPDTFQNVHVRLVSQVVKACEQQNVPVLIHMSALNADAENGASLYLRSKGEGKQRVMAGQGPHLDVCCLEPSIIFAHDDAFFNRFARLLSMTPWVFPLASPESKFAPVFVGDVVQAILMNLANKEHTAKCYSLCGPKVYTFLELVTLTAKWCGLKRRIIPLDPAMSALQARVLEWLPGKPMTRDNLRSLSVDSVCTDNGLIQLGIQPTAIEAVMPQHLGQTRNRRRYLQLRRQT